MPLVVRIERVSPPTHTDVLEAAAKACLAIADDPRRSEAWAPAFDRWLDGRFRKVVRRARGAHWSAVGELPGVTVRSGTAEVRALPPAPNDTLPPEVRRLQVGGTDLADPDPDGQARPQPVPGAARLWLHPTLAMTTGKAAAQAGHASMLLWDALAADPSRRAAWRAAGYPLVVRRAASVERWDELARSAWAEVADGGFTEIPRGSVTVRAEPPATSP